MDKKTGAFRHDGVEIELVDLPGTYSLSAYSPEEVIARDYILNETRYRMLLQSNPETAERLFAEAQEAVNEHWHKYERMAAQEV